MIDKLRGLCGMGLRCLPGIAAVMFVVGGFVTLSLWCAHDHASDFHWIPQVQNRSFYFGVFAGMAVVFIALPLAAKSFAPFMMPVKHAVSSWFFVWLLTGLVVCLVLTLHLADTLERQQGQSRLDSWLMLIEKNPGGIFAVVTGLATVIALFYTWRELSAIRQSISSFSDLIDRVCRMAKKATPEDPLQILAYTPAIGFLAQPLNDWNRFRNALDQKPSGKPIAEIICLREQDLDVWHKLFVGRSTLRGPVTKDMAESATHAANSLLQHLSEDSVGNPISGTVHRLPWRFMPGFYLFITRMQAIIVTPLFMPFPKGAPKDQQEKLPSVQMIGVETHDRAIIRDVQSIFQYYKALPPTPLAEAHQEVLCSVLQTWIGNLANAHAALQPLHQQLLGCPGLTSASITALQQSNPNCEISISLDAHIKTW